MGTFASSKGDHIIITRIKIPKSVTPEQRQLFIKLSETEGTRETAEPDSKFDSFKNMFR